jgi:hypothetical protein
MIYSTFHLLESQEGHRGEYPESVAFLMRKSKSSVEYRTGDAFLFRVVCHAKLAGKFRHFCREGEGSVCLPDFSFNNVS